ncbi:MAG TPA: SUMF1/EgtB/PvdO family nonheme iron enzyme [Phototrophicaceae bacterium]|nr:SUMF1/EgtB/PvdO family nonheme iron enzyme [Phototrophicaceae bacterium]
MSHIFISYSKKDREYARKLADKLLAEGFDVWIDDRIDYGEDWWRTIVRNICSASAFIVIMTPDSDTSEWVQREVTLADKHKIPAFPLWLEGDFHNSENWAIYVRTQYADVRGGMLPSDDFYLRLGNAVSPKATPDVEVDRVPAAQEGKVAGAVHEPPLQNPQPQKLILPNVSTILPPPFEWCEVPAGRVTIEYGETDYKTFDIPAFAIAKYPITNAQYQVFVDAVDGYCNTRWWAYSDFAKELRKTTPQPRKSFRAVSEMPRTNVTWYDAIAFCQWLTIQVTTPKITNDVLVTLPTEQQWQRAAQGDSSCKYPWGDDFGTRRCNTSNSLINQLTPVTNYIDGQSPYGVLDMSGNAWEWCLTGWDNDSISLRDELFRVMRGGSFIDSKTLAQVTYRDASFPDLRSLSRGFRLVANTLL